MSVQPNLNKQKQSYFQAPVLQKYINRSDLSYQEKIILKEGLSKYFIFSKLNEEQLVEAVKYSQYMILQPKEQIFNIGDCLEYFYVIIKGSVSQYCTEHSYEMAKSRQKQCADTILATAESTSQKVFRIKILSEGDYLGEQALLNTEQNHQSALQAVAEGPEVHLLAININMYKQYLQTASRNNLINDISIMQSNNMFYKWEFDMIRLLYFFSVKQTFYNGQTLFKEDDMSKAVYIILKGEFGVNH